ncbi:MAG: DNA primase [Candidatus Pacebacteria bacterium]|nr:DNA primase [Candidatus Paceibacterota bacterium]
MTSDIEEIKSRLNIVDVVSSYIKLEKAGINYRARCPFHSEKSPSFFVSPARQTWHCFGGCSEGGDMFKFVMKIEGVDFPDALKMLAQKAGVRLKIQGKEWEQTKTERQLMISICEASCKFYETQLKKSKTGEEVKEYLLKRGMKEETINEWRLGYAPSVWQGLSDFLIGQGYEKEDIVKAGLASKKDSQRIFDRFRGRIMFPIFDFNSQVIGFTGRIFGKNDDEAKYLNVPNTLLYDKSRALYGMDKAKMEIRQNDFCVLVEGNVDCIMSHQAGIKNCIAVSGTALTPIHLGIIKRYSSNLVLAFDMDLAGNNATKKGIDLALKNGFDVKVIPIVEEKDPADIVLLEGDEKWKELISNAKPINEFYFNLALKGRDVNDLESKKQIVKNLLPIFKKIANNIEQSYWIENLSHKLKIKEEDIRSEMKKINVEESSFEDVKLIEREKKTRKDLLEESLLTVLLIDGSKSSLIEESDIDELSPLAKDVILLIKEKPDISFEEINKALGNSSEIVNLLSYVAISSELMKDSDIKIDEEWNKCLMELRMLKGKKDRGDLSQQIKDLEKEGAFDKIKELLDKFNSLIKKDEENKKEDKSKNN